ncbi:glycosyltransferase family 1 protein [Erythrobacter arachoides]|uniref:Glycosyltransferase family 1 protein n=1 Tax=Aurantiacibacter arachoides TaxID=1850444 RepID=A0A844ZXX0_9SPHN|nr:glycosyltransferase family 1 protein [Aurantiacibacter arachoides]MXO92973.1 glycosyltransferase family 1 protein [Aurantiacibacter arachoides]GGD53020.1 glycosyl transferase [Aurantiacibacter arachoides]
MSELEPVRKPLNIFYAEPDPDRWFPGDRYPRRLLRHLIRGPGRGGGHRRVFLNLLAGLDRIGVPYRVNDFRYIRTHPEELACIIGKPFLLDKHKWRNPILLGASIYSHPIDDPTLLDRLDVRRILVPGPWMETMCKPYWGDRVEAWPVGIDTSGWSPSNLTPEYDVLVYDKILWDYESTKPRVVTPILDELRSRSLRVAVIRYGSYEEENYRSLLARSRSMVFLCEHETQGIAYQQALSCGVPLLAWDQGGPWLDPSYFPDKVVFEPISSVPYFDSRCGERFASAEDFPAALHGFLTKLDAGAYDPRAFVLENLTLEACARRYVEIADSIIAELS